MESARIAYEPFVSITPLTRDRVQLDILIPLTSMGGVLLETQWADSDKEPTLILHVVPAPNEVAHLHHRVEVPPNSLTCEVRVCVHPPEGVKKPPRNRRTRVMLTL